MNTLKKVQKQIHKRIKSEVEASETLGAIKLEGKVQSWDDVITAGKIAAQYPYRGVINDLHVEGIDSNRERMSTIRDSKLEGRKTDVLIIGGGIVGTAIARELSKYDIDILLVDKENDLGLHQSSRNDGMVHPGVMPKPDTKKAYYNVRGNEMFEQIANELNVPYERVGTYVMFESRILSFLGRALIKRAKANGVKGVHHVSRKEILLDEKNIPDSVVGAIHMPTTGVCPPYEMTIAMGESAVINGADISLNTQVLDIQRNNNSIVSVQTNRGKVYPEIVINAAGLFADKIAEMADDRFFTIHPRKGQVALLDMEKGDQLHSVVSIVSLKSAIGDTKGGGLVKTADGNILVGPSAHEQPYKEDYSTDKMDMKKVLDKNLRYVKGLYNSDVITYLAGNRAATYKEDFIIEPSHFVDNLIYAAGIQSPGYASAPAIAAEVSKMTISKLNNKTDVKKKKDFIKNRKGTVRIAELDDQEKQKYIDENKEYGKIICRCEQISKGEILDAIHSPVPAHTTEGVKRRTRSGMGRCQGGFCKPLVAKIIQEETNLSMDEILSKGEMEI